MVLKCIFLVAFISMAVTEAAGEIPELNDTMVIPFGLETIWHLFKKDAMAKNIVKGLGIVGALHALKRFEEFRTPVIPNYEYKAAALNRLNGLNPLQVPGHSGSCTCPHCSGNVAADVAANGAAHRVPYYPRTFPIREIVDIIKSL